MRLTSTRDLTVVVVASSKRLGLTPEAFLIPGYGRWDRWLG